MELPLAVDFHPGVVDHQDARRKAVGQDALGVLQDIGLVLVVLEFNPGVVLRNLEEIFGRNRAGRREKCAHGETIGAGKVPGDDRCLIVIVEVIQHEDVPFLAERERLGAPDITALAGKEERRDLVAVVLI